MHVASRTVTNINNLHPVGKYNVNTVQMNQDATTGYNRLQEQAKFEPGNTMLIVIVSQYHCLAQDL